MKSFINRFAVFAASAVVLGTMAYGQTMKAEIPFAFHTANASLPAGNYVIDRVSGAGFNNVLRLYNTDSHRSVVAVSTPLDMYSGTAQKSAVVFACGGQGCTLREIKTRDYFFYAGPVERAWRGIIRSKGYGAGSEDVGPATFGRSDQSVALPGPPRAGFSSGVGQLDAQAGSLRMDEIHDLV